MLCFGTCFNSNIGLHGRLIQKLTIRFNIVLTENILILYCYEIEILTRDVANICRYHIKLDDKKSDRILNWTFNLVEDNKCGDK